MVFESEAVRYRATRVLVVVSFVLLGKDLERFVENSIVPYPCQYLVGGSCCAADRFKAV